MKILALETATPVASLAITEGPRVLAEISIDAPGRHGERLLVAAEFLMKSLEMSPSDIEAYAVDVGPGSFTGLRTGLALAKGLDLANPRPAAGVSSLNALALAGSTFSGLVVPLIDAKKGEVYAALYRADGKGGLVAESEEMAIAPERIPEMVSGPALILGDGLEKYGALLREALGPESVFAPERLWSPQAGVVAQIAAKAIEAGKDDDLDSLMPAYIRHSDAELSLATPGNK